MHLRLIVAGLLLAACWLPAAQARSLRVVTVEAPPLITRAEDGSALGAVADVVREALRRAGHTADIRVMPWKRALKLVQEGQADGLFAASRNEERAAVLHYPDEPLIRAKVVVVADAARGLAMDRDGTGTDGLEAAMLSGASHGERLRRFLDRARFSQVHQIASQDQIATMTLGGRFDAFIIVDPLLPFLRSHIQGGEALDVVPTPSGEPFVIDEIDGYFVFSKMTTDAHDASAFSDALRAMKTDGSYYRLLHIPPPPGP